MRPLRVTEFIAPRSALRMTPLSVENRMSASTDALPVRNDLAVISLVGFVHAVSHFYHLVIPLLNSLL